MEMNDPPFSVNAITTRSVFAFETKLFIMNKI